jgi:hypothetical protein
MKSVNQSEYLLKVVTEVVLTVLHSKLRCEPGVKRVDCLLQA